PGEHAGARDDHRPLRAGPIGGDDLLRAPERREGLQRGCSRLRRADPALAADAADPRKRLAVPRLAGRELAEALATLLEARELVVACAGGAQKHDVTRLGERRRMRDGLLERAVAEAVDDVCKPLRL